MSGLNFWFILISSAIVATHLFLLLILDKIILNNFPRNILTDWLREIKSDIFIFSKLMIFFFGLNPVAKILIKNQNKLIDKLTTSVNSILLYTFFLLISIALISVVDTYSERFISNSPRISEIDKRNFLTAIPILASIVKIFMYACYTILFMSALDIDTRPFLNIGAIILAALSFAGSDTIKSIIYTIKIFMTRRYYVGSILKINDLPIGQVVRITIFDTTIADIENKEHTYIIDNCDIKIIKVIKKSN